MFNKELMLKVRDAIAAHPENTNMSDWIDCSSCSKNPVPTECGTTSCLAGWALWFGAPKKWEQYALGNNVDVEREAIELLGITDGDAKNLFYLSRWSRFVPGIFDSYTSEDLNEDSLVAELAIQTIDAFIAKKEEEKRYE